MMHSQHKSSTDSFHFKAVQRRWRGSLPLKKRRFNEISSSFHESALRHLPQVSGSEQVIPLSTSDPNVTVGIDTTATRHRHHHHQYTDDNIAALALVAAATASANVSILSSTDGVVRPSLTATINGTHNRPGTHQDQQLVQHKINIGSKRTSCEIKSYLLHDAKNSNDVLGALAAQDAKQNPYFEDFSIGVGGNSSKAISPTQSRPRVNHPPLAAPKPGGCHGRTSRNNSYCRRTPCYNGSNYCKLHYQQYVVQGGADPNGIGGSAARLNLVKSDAPKVKSDGNIHTKSSNDGTVAIEGGDNAISHHRYHQDKRYTGLCAGEIQCFATTTRGRACAYVAVTGMKYCHLHADYDTNPPPRRGGTGSSSYKTKTATELTQLELRRTAVDHTNAIESIVGKCDQLGLSLNSQFKESDALSALQVAGKMKYKTSFTSSTVSLPSLEMPLQCATTNDRAGRNHSTSKPVVNEKIPPGPSSNTINTLNPPPYPLLNSIPSDKWSQRLVLISAGPLVNHVGRVVKWGNGWITVSTQTGVDGKYSSCDGSSSAEFLHNRRAIELYLLPNDSVHMQLEDVKILTNCGSATSLSVSEALPTVIRCKSLTHSFSTNHDNTEEISESKEKKQHEEGHNPASEKVGAQRGLHKAINVPKKHETETAPANTVLDKALPVKECTISSFGGQVCMNEVKTVVSMTKEAIPPPLDKKYANELQSMLKDGENRNKCKLIVSRDVVTDDLRLVNSLRLVEPMARDERVSTSLPPHSLSESLAKVDIKDDEYRDINCLSLMEKPTLTKDTSLILASAGGQLTNKHKRPENHVIVEKGDSQCRQQLHRCDTLHNEEGSGHNPPSAILSSECNEKGSDSSGACNSSSSKLQSRKYHQIILNKGIQMDA